MRMMDFAILIIFLQVFIGFTIQLGQSQNGQMGLFPNPNNSFFKGEQGGEIQKYQQSVNGTWGTTPEADLITFGMDFILAGFKTLIMIATSFLSISLVLYTQFGLDPKFCAALQVVIYIVYLWGFLQWKSGRGGRMYE
jgi:hypothetical protein